MRMVLNWTLERQIKKSWLLWMHGITLTSCVATIVLNGLENTLYNVYSPLKTTKELWDSLDKKYKTEDAGLKKLIVGKFLDFKMVDSKTVLSQVQELQVVVHDIHAEGMTLS